MSPAPLLSVVVPFYGVEDYLAECLDSILAQTLTDFEVILVDDGSRDGSGAIAEEYAARDPRLRLVRQPNAGLGPARNTGVRHARGRYLMFVDSDDLLAPRAFQLLVGTLERTGSDFAVGNAWRFTRTRGTWPSWTHQLPCAEDRERTNVRAFPALIRDRMAWNKVYRRSFWDAHSYEFPAIRYEDFPITLRAHLDAAAVDVVAQRVYLWRDRESGESITQQVFNARNAEDRTTSANLVLDLVDGPGVPDQVREDLHAYFVEVDLVALAGALAEAGWADRAHLETIVRRLALRLHPQAAGRVPRLSALVHKGLRDGDFEFVRALARWRASGDRRALLGELRRRPRQLPAVLAAITPRRRPPGHPLRPRRLEVTMTSAVEEAGRFVVNADVTLRQQFRLTAVLTASLRAGDVTVPLLVEPARKWESLKVRIVITPEDVRACAGAAARLVAEARRYALHWSGGVRVPDTDELPPVLDVGDGTWAVASLPATGPAELRVGVLTGAIVAEGRKVADDVAELRLNRDAGLVLRRPAPAADVPLPAAAATVTLPAADLVAGDPPDDPVLRVNRRAVTTAAGERVYCSRFPGAIGTPDAVVRLVPTRGGWCEARVTHAGASVTTR